jgi:hypothetical protein
MCAVDRPTLFHIYYKKCDKYSTQCLKAQRTFGIGKQSNVSISFWIVARSWSN